MLNRRIVTVLIKIELIQLLPLFLIFLADITTWANDYEDYLTFINDTGSDIEVVCVQKHENRYYASTTSEKGFYFIKLKSREKKSVSVSLQTNLILIRKDGVLLEKQLELLPSGQMPSIVRISELINPCLEKGLFLNSLSPPALIWGTEYMIILILIMTGIKSIDFKRNYFKFFLVLIGGIISCVWIYKYFISLAIFTL